MSDGEWWCPECKEVVHPMQVTYTERHGVCGHAVEWVVDAKAQDEIHRLRKENERLRNAIKRMECSCFMPDREGIKCDRCRALEGVSSWTS